MSADCPLSTRLSPPQSFASLPFDPTRTPSSRVDEATMVASKWKRKRREYLKHRASIPARTFEERRKRQPSLPTKTSVGGKDALPHLRPELDPLVQPARIRQYWNDEAVNRAWNKGRESYNKDMVDVKLEFRQSIELRPKTTDFCYHIVKHTSMEDYERSSIGWNVSDKLKELLQPTMMYILVRAPGEVFAPTDALNTDIIGFISFKIDFDDPPHERRNVMYIFEVHIAERFRGKGLGKFLVSTVEMMGKSVSILKTMLTVFMANTSAIEAYKKLGYTKDEASPAGRVLRGGKRVEPDYMIMQKWRPRTGEMAEPAPSMKQLGLTRNKKSS